MFFKSKPRCGYCGSKQIDYRHLSGRPKCLVCGTFASGPLPPKRRFSLRPKLLYLLRPKLLYLIAASLLVLSLGGGGLWVAYEASIVDAGCLIKGDISHVNGERTYHVVGSEYYYATTINTEAGERWFCTEEDAQAAGWRRSKR